MAQSKAFFCYTESQIEQQQNDGATDPTVH